ncbi:MAG: DmsE family decaheme c-type cytochrome [Telluria sp.]|nr:DmsE family decaheme c-type cytochrome [Telluria sp.]
MSSDKKNKFRSWVAALLLFACGGASGAATYVGEARCAGCHALEQEHWAHTTHAKAFHFNPRNELEKKNCEACHGPGSRHLENPSDKTALFAFTRKGGTPIERQNGQCLQCHQSGNRIAWSGSMHQVSQIACTDCHNPMSRASATGLLVKDSITTTCYSCHQQQRAEFGKRSHMPLPEGKMSCADCHNPHGSSTRPLLKADSVNQLCYTCHTEKRGPFLWEHAPVRENCINCHNAHGSNNEKLLNVASPFLCQQCHSHVQHPNDLANAGNIAASRSPDVRGMNRGCQNCHSQIHGSNHPSGVRMHR